MTHEFKKMIGKTEVKVTIPLLQRIRERLKAPDMANLPNIHAAKILMTEFPELSERTLEGYTSSLRGSSDFVFGLLVDGKISVGMLNELSSGELDMATRDTLARICLERNMSASQVAAVKRDLKTHKRKMSLHEAVQRACGEIPEHARPEHVRETMKTFGKVVGDLNDSAIKFMTKLQMALDLLPHSAVASGESYLDVYEKITTLENTLENALGFTSSRKAKLFEALKGHIIAEAEMSQHRIKGGES